MKQYSKYSGCGEGGKHLWLGNQERLYDMSGI